MKIGFNVHNYRLIDIHNFCILNDAELNLEKEEIVLLEVDENVI